MKVTGLDNKDYVINTSKYKKQNRQCSNLHKKARELLKEAFPSTSILEEVVLPGSVPTANRGTSLRADFMIPDYNIIVEVQGKQHIKYTPHFHESETEFLRAKARDNNKLLWAEANEFEVIYLYEGESESEWRKKLGC